MSEPYEDRADEYRHELDGAMGSAVPCRYCGGMPSIDSHGSYGWHLIVCDNCYDGAPDAGPQNTADGNDPVEAVEAWNDAQRAGGE